MADETTTDDSDEAPRGKLTIGLPGPSAPPPPPREPAAEPDSSAPQPAVQAADDDQERPADAARPAPVRIDVRDLRTHHRRWAPTLRNEGRAAAIAAVDPDVHRQARRDAEQAYRSGRDVHMLLPSHDPAAVADAIAQAREYGYTVTLSVRVHPDVPRRLAALASYHEHAKSLNARQAVAPAEQESQLEQMRRILQQAHADQSVDRIAIYPPEGTRPAYSAELRREHNEAGERIGAAWNTAQTPEEAIAALRSRDLSPQEATDARTEVMRLARDLPRAEGLGNPEHRNVVADGLNDAARALGMDPVDPERARGATVEAPDVERSARAGAGEAQQPQPAPDHQEAERQAAAGPPEEPGNEHRTSSATPPEPKEQAGEQDSAGPAAAEPEQAAAAPSASAPQAPSLEEALSVTSTGGGVTAPAEGAEPSHSPVPAPAMTEHARASAAP